MGFLCLYMFSVHSVKSGLTTCCGRGSANALGAAINVKANTVTDNIPINCLMLPPFNSLHKALYISQAMSDNIHMTQKALFAAGCFWGVQYYFDQVPGVTKSTAGYAGGRGSNPTWESTHGKDSDFAESVLLEFDSRQVSYEVLLKHFFRLHDPTQKDGQGPNIGTNYRSVIFYFDNAQKQAAENVRKELQKQLDEPIVTEITLASTFYEAEAFHQKYTEKTGQGMCHTPYEPL